MHKVTGTYYTPPKLADFVVKHLLRDITQVDGGLRVLEPSVGNGVFVNALRSHLDDRNFRVDLTIVDIDSKAVKNVKKSNFGHNGLVIESYVDDFLSARKSLKKFDLIIGNPPFIRKRNLTEKSKNLCQQVHLEADLSCNRINNIWTSFVVASEALLNKGGRMAFVLPADILQVKYAEEIRHFLETKFERLELFVLKQKDFASVDQQTLLLFCYKKSSQKGTYFMGVKSYPEATFKTISRNGLMVADTKWTHHLLRQKDIQLLNKIRKKMITVGECVETAPGIVTGANHFFIINEATVNLHGAGKYSIPIISRSEYVDSIDFGVQELEDLRMKGKPVNLLDLSNKRKNQRLDRYLKTGEQQMLPSRHKCSQRAIWYEVPNIKMAPQAFVFKRCYHRPKLIKNLSGCVVTDAAYTITPKNSVDLNSFIRSFYTSVTLIYAELLGRKYGGGVLELTPNEFRSLPISYQIREKEEYTKFSRNYDFNGTDHQHLYPEWLVSELNLTDTDLSRLKTIYAKLLKARLGK